MEPYTTLCEIMKALDSFALDASFRLTRRRLLRYFAAHKTAVARWIIAPSKSRDPDFDLPVEIICKCEFEPDKCDFASAGAKRPGQTEPISMVVFHSFPSVTW